MGVELIGIIGTLFIVVAFLQNGEQQIRRLDLVGAGFFILYGFCLPSFSTILLNSILFGIQVVKLIKIRKDQALLKEARRSLQSEG